MSRSITVRVKTLTAIATSRARPSWARPPTPEYSPSVSSRTKSTSRSSGPRFASGPGIPLEQPDGAQVGPQVELLADRQQQAPERLVVGNRGIADVDARGASCGHLPGRGGGVHRGGQAHDLDAGCDQRAADGSGDVAGVGGVAVHADRRYVDR